MISYIKKFAEEFILAIVPSRFHATFVTPTYINSYGPKTPYHGLFSWEDIATKNFFPPPPAKILIGGAGSGRELILLGKKGYYLSGFEPILISATHAKSCVPKEKLLVFQKGKYEDLVKGTLQEIEKYKPYDAVILGWGSISHILDPNMHKFILQKVRNVCPNGPILLSWRRASYASPKVRFLRKIFSFCKLRTSSERDYFRFDLGFCHSFSKDEIENLAKSTNNSIAFYEDEKTYPHAVLFPKAMPALNPQSNPPHLQYQQTA